MRRRFPPRPHPSMNPSCYLGTGRGVYEVEGEMLSLGRDLVGSGWRKFLTRAFWRLWALEFKYWPTTFARVKSDRDKYYAQVASSDFMRSWRSPSIALEQQVTP
jgi:hypothetical protein